MKRCCHSSQAGERILDGGLNVGVRLARQRVTGFSRDQDKLNVSNVSKSSAEAAWHVAARWAPTHLTTNATKVFARRVGRGNCSYQAGDGGAHRLSCTPPLGAAATTPASCSRVLLRCGLLVHSRRAPRHSRHVVGPIRIAERTPDCHRVNRKSPPCCSQRQARGHKAACFGDVDVMQPRPTEAPTLRLPVSALR